MHSFIDEIKAVILKYKLILSARVVAFKSSVKVAYRKLMGKPEPKKRGRPKKAKGKVTKIKGKKK